jgi:hypothetical protein
VHTMLHDDGFVEVEVSQFVRSGMLRRQALAAMPVMVCQYEGLRIQSAGLAIS